jgi:hypothetical protein
MLWNRSLIIKRNKTIVVIIMAKSIKIGYAINKIDNLLRNLAAAH